MGAPEPDPSGPTSPVHQRGMLRLGQRLTLVALVVYALVLARVTLVPGQSLVGGRANSFMPFRTIREQATDAVSVSVFVHQVLGNVVLFVPLGLALGLSGITRWRVALLLVAVSVSIEALQVLVVPNRAGDVDDVILNLTGGIAGYIIGRVAQVVAVRQRGRRRAHGGSQRGGLAGGAESGRTGLRLRYYRTGRVSQLVRALRHSGGFGMVQLNGVGWLAVLAPGAVAGGATASVIDSFVPFGALLGVGTTWVVALCVDTVRWRSSTISFQLPAATAPEVEELIVRLAGQGVPASSTQETGPDPTTVVWQVSTQMRHRRTVESALGWP